MARFFEWSVMAMYSYPHASAASAISRIEFRPSLAVVCMCTSPRMSLCFDTLRQLVPRRRLNLAQVLAHLRRHPVHAQRGVDLLLRRRGHRRDSSSSRASAHSLSV